MTKTLEVISSLKERLSVSSPCGSDTAVALGARATQKNLIVVFKLSSDTITANCDGCSFVLDNSLTYRTEQLPVISCNKAGRCRVPDFF